MARVLFEHVEKRYARVGPPTVRDLSLEVRDRELMVLVGPSGCGKSTALRMIAGLEALSAGALWIGDRRVDGVPPKDRDVAMVFQSYALYPHMTCFENMAFALTLKRVPKREIEARVTVAARSLGIEDLLARKPKQLSGGQRQRVAIGRAIVREPQVFLMDEPLSNLDAKLRVSMRAEIKRLHDRIAATMVYVTHDQTEAMTLGDRICVLRAGDLVQCGPPEELYQRPATAFVAAFIGSPEMNLVPGEVSAGRVTGRGYALDGLGALGASGGGPREVLVGFRPEHLTVVGPDEGFLRGEVALVESNGSEAFARIDTETGAITARLGESARGHVRPGERLGLSVDPTRIHLFDRVTEARCA
jgi:multiple sugar transport system ATP-binding protein